MNDAPQTDTSTQDSAPSGVENQAPPVTATPDSPQTDAADSGAGSQNQQPPATPPHAEGETTESLTPPKSVAPNTQNPADGETLNRLRSEKAHWARQNGEIRRQYEDTRSQLAKFQQEHEKTAQLAAQQKLALHDFRHPDHASKFQPILAKADAVRRQVARIRQAKAPDGFTPEQTAQWRQSQEDFAMSDLSDDEHTALNQFNEHSQAFDRKWKLNPASTLNEYVIPMIRQEMQRTMHEQQAAQSVDADFNDPISGPIIKEMQGEMAEAIQRLGGTDEAYEFVKKQAVNYAQNNHYMKGVVEENARLKQQLEAAGIKAQSASVLQALAKGTASVTRDVAPRNDTPPYEIAAKWADKRGIPRGSREFFQHLREVQQNLAR